MDHETRRHRVGPNWYQRERERDQRVDTGHWDVLASNPAYFSCIVAFAIWRVYVREPTLECLSWIDDIWADWNAVAGSGDDLGAELHHSNVERIKPHYRGRAKG